jgi:protein SCO1/2
MRKPIAIACFTLASLAAAAAGPSALPGRWTDDRGRALDWPQGHETPIVVTMAYGSCKRICASSLRTMKQLQALADAQHRTLQFVVVGLDPAQDTPADWAALRRDHHLERANWHFLSGADADLRRLAARLDLRYWRYGEHTLHDYRVALLAPDGRVLKRLDRPDENPSSLLD